MCGGQGAKKGLALGWHITIGGRTGYGKSLMALNLGCHAARNGHSVCYVNLEMSRDQIDHRCYAILTGNPVQELTPGDEFSFKRRGFILEESDKEIPVGTHFYANKHRLTKINHIEEFMLRHLDLGCEFFVVDYLQRARSDARTEIEKVIDTSITISDFSKEHGVVTIGLSQLRKSAAEDFDTSPTIYDLKGSTQLVDDSVQVAVLDHADYEERTYDARLGTPRHRRAKTNLIIGKNRDGEQGKVPIEWDFLNLTVSQQTGG